MRDSTRGAKMQPSTLELILELRLGGAGRSRTYLEGFSISPAWYGIAPRKTFCDCSPFG